jgi:glycosyltransferase involved in cell wall biosynthesis
MFRPESVGLLRNGRLDQAGLEAFPPRSGARTALFAARLVAGKGVWQLLEGAARVAAIRPEFTLLIVGNGEEESAMRAWIATRRLESRLRMLGYQADMAPYYAQADFVIVPTQPKLWLEGLPLVALEAKGLALPVLYSRSGGLPDSQVEGETGLLLDPPDAEGIASGILALMDNPARYHRMRGAIRLERQRWGLRPMIEAYVEEYRREFQRRSI